MPQIVKFLALPLETQRRRLKQQIHDTVPDGEVKETAAASGLEAYTLYKMRDGNEVKYNLLRPELLQIMHSRQDFRLLDFLDGLFNRVALILPDADDNPEISDLTRETYQLVADFADFLKEESKDLTSGDLTPEQLARCNKKIRVVIGHLGGHLKHLEKYCQDHHSESDGTGAAGGEG
jgi:hypothetical protein